MFLHPDVAKIGVHPWKHYWTQGRKAGYTMGWPSQEEFSADDYYAQNPDVKEAGYDAWKHYVEHGKSEHRLLTPTSNEKCTTLIEAGQIAPSTISFSIIMPTWNRADCIQRSINSILDQTWQNFELIIADDGSDDNTEELIYEKYGKEVSTHKTF